VNDQRSQFKRRALQEFRLSFAADSSEASIAHVQLAKLQFERCRDCTAEKTEDCTDCPMALMCNADRRSYAESVAEKLKSS
jgi:hypothetical protein